VNLDKKNTIQYEENKVSCTHSLGEIDSQLELSETLSKTLTVSIKEKKKHITYSMDEVEEKAIYIFLKGRHERH